MLFENRIGHRGEQRVDLLQVADGVEMDGAGLQALRRAFAQPDEVAITPDAAWGLTPQTSLRDLTTLQHPDGTTITIDRSSSGLDFRIRRPGRKEKTLRVQWKK